MMRPGFRRAASFGRVGVPAKADPVAKAILSEAISRSNRVAVRAAVLLLGTLLGVLLVGCASPQSTTSASDPAVQGRWQLQEGYDAEGAFDLTESWITLDIARTTNGTGLTPCNNYGITLIGGPGAVYVSQTFRTKASCASDELTRLEARYLSTLVSANHATAGEGRLVLNAPDSQLTFVQASQLRSKEIVETAWVLESLVTWQGGEPILSRAGGDGTLWVDATGGFRGGTGCRYFDGRYEVQNGEVVITRITPELNYCGPESQAQELHVSVVLSGMVRVEVLGDLLTLRNDTFDRGLLYRAIR